MNDPQGIDVLNGIYATKAVSMKMLGYTGSKYSRAERAIKSAKSRFKGSSLWISEASDEGSCFIFKFVAHGFRVSIMMLPGFFVSEAHAVIVVDLSPTNDPDTEELFDEGMAVNVRGGATRKRRFGKISESGPRNEIIHNLNDIAVYAHNLYATLNEIFEKDDPSFGSLVPLGNEEHRIAFINAYAEEIRRDNLERMRNEYSSFSNSIVREIEMESVNFDFSISEIAAEYSSVDDLLLAGSPYKVQPLRYDDLITLAPTRAGNGVGIVTPNLPTVERSGLVIDPKGEMARTVGEARLRFRTAVHVIDPFEVWGTLSAAYNPLEQLTPGELDLGGYAASLAAALVMHSSDDVTEAHWNEKAKAILGRMIMFCICHEDQNRQTLSTVREYLTLPPVEFRALLELMQVREEAGGLIAYAVNCFLDKADGDDALGLSNIACATESMDAATKGACIQVVPARWQLSQDAGVINCYDQTRSSRLLGAIQKTKGVPGDQYYGGEKPVPIITGAFFRNSPCNEYANGILFARAETKNVSSKMNINVDGVISLCKTGKGIPSAMSSQEQGIYFDITHDAVEEVYSADLDKLGEPGYYPIIPRRNGCCSEPSSMFGTDKKRSNYEWIDGMNGHV